MHLNDTQGSFSLRLNESVTKLGAFKLAKYSIFLLRCNQQRLTNIMQRYKYNKKSRKLANVLYTLKNTTVVLHTLTGESIVFTYMTVTF